MHILTPLKKYLRLSILNKAIRIGFSIMVCSGPAFSQITTVANNNAQQLVQSILGKGFTVSNAKLTCPTDAVGNFTSTTSNIGLGTGILLTTGSINNANGPNNNSGKTTKNGGAGDTQLDSLSGTNTEDACALEFDLVPSCDEFKIRYVFASEEYPEYVGSTFNDIFAFFISGPGITGTVNIATIPNTNIPVTINNVNAKKNSQYFVDNTNGKTVEYNGFTKPLTASIKVIPCSSYHLKMAIADVGDEEYDSGVFVEAGSISCDSPEIIAPPVCANAPVIQLCAPDGYTYDWPVGQPGAVPPYNQKCLTINNPKAGDAYTVNLTLVGGGCPIVGKLSLKGADFKVHDTSVCTGSPKFPLIVTPLTAGNYTFKWAPATNLSCSTCQSPVFDPVSSQTYTVTMTDSNLANCNQVKVVKVTVGTSFTVSTSDVEICEGEEAALTVTGADSYVWKDPAGTTYTGASIKVNPVTTTTYTVTGTALNATCPGKSEATATVTVEKKPIVNVSDLIICKGEAAILNGQITGGASKGIWTDGAGIFVPDRSALNAAYTPTPAEETAGTVSLTLESEDPPGPCGKSSKTMTIKIIDLKVDAGPHQTICAGNTVTLSGTMNGVVAPGIWSGGSGIITSGATIVYSPSKAEEAAGKVILTFTVHDPLNPCPRASDTMSITIIQKTIVSAGDPITICEGGTIHLSGSVSGGTNAGTWSGGSGIYTPGNTDLKAFYKPTAAEIAAGQVTFILTPDTAGLCPSSTAEVTHIIHPSPVVKFSVNTPKACIPHCVDFSDSTTAGNTSIEKWEWDFGNGVNSTSKNPKQICYNTPGVYDVQLTVTSNKQCVSTITANKMIETYSNPVAQFVASPNPASVYDPKIYLHDLSTSDVKSWLWDFGDGMKQTLFAKDALHTYPKGIPYIYTIKLAVINANGCRDSIEHLLELKPDFIFYIPNAFTPSDVDGVNDMFFGKGSGIADYHIWIFDRWGNMIFDATDINKGWDGHANGGADISQQDVYVWKVKLKDVFGKIHDYTGTVTLLK
jgi:gliding motility-associated-like protein